MNSKTDADAEKHEDPMRKMVHLRNNQAYSVLESFEIAKKTQSGYMIMQGDDGGQLYLTIPAHQVKCKEKVLLNLLKELDALAWNDLTMATIIYEVYSLGSVISGGMGGGYAGEELWVHKNFEGIKDKIASVLSGMRDSLL